MDTGNAVITSAYYSHKIKTNINDILHLDTLFQIISLLPVYILQICYGMNSGYPAIATAQLLVPESCPGFQITKYQAGVIGNNSIRTI